MRVIGRFAESKDAVLFARFSEVDKCEFIKMNAPEDAWTSTDDGAGVLVKTDALREQAREVLVSATRYRTSSLPQPAWALTCFSYLLPCVLALTNVAESRRHRSRHTTAVLASGRRWASVAALAQM